MKILLHGVHKKHYIYSGFSANLGAKNLTSYLPYNYFVRHNDPFDISDSDGVLDRLDSFDLIVFNQRSFMDKNFKKILNCDTSAPKIFIDIEDDFFVRNIYHSPQIKYYIKRELYSHMDGSVMKTWMLKYLYGSYVYEVMRDSAPVSGSYSFPALPSFLAVQSSERKKLLPFSTTVEPVKVKPSTKKEYDLFYCCTVGNVPDRKKYYDILLGAQSRYQKARMFVKPGGIPKDEFMKSVLSSKVGVSVRGGGFVANADWELPCYGVALLLQRRPLVVPWDHIDGKTALLFGSSDELFEKFEKYVLKSDEWKEIAKGGQKLYYAHHTPQKLIKEQVIDKVFK